MSSFLIKIQIIIETICTHFFDQDSIETIPNSKFDQDSVETTCIHFFDQDSTDTIFTFLIKIQLKPFPILWASSNWNHFQFFDQDTIETIFKFENQLG